MAICYIGIGSNLGDRDYYIRTAIKKIKTLDCTRVNKVSSVIETAAVGGPIQGKYLNAVAEISTDLTPHKLLFELQRIENALGRTRSIKNGPRTIDLDILLYEDIRVNEEALCIPHPRMLEREFVLGPLEEIAADVVKRLKEKA